MKSLSQTLKSMHSDSSMCCSHFALKTKNTTARTDKTHAHMIPWWEEVCFRAENFSVPEKLIVSLVSKDDGWMFLIKLCYRNQFVSYLFSTLSEGFFSQNIFIVTPGRMWDKNFGGERIEALISFLPNSLFLPIKSGQKEGEGYFETSGTTSIRNKRRGKKWRPISECKFFSFSSHLKNMISKWRSIHFHQERHTYG